MSDREQELLAALKEARAEIFACSPFTMEEWLNRVDKLIASADASASRAVSPEQPSLPSLRWEPDEESGIGHVVHLDGLPKFGITADGQTVEEALHRLGDILFHAFKDACMEPEAHYKCEQESVSPERQAVIEEAERLLAGIGDIDKWGLRSRISVPESDFIIAAPRLLTELRDQVIRQQEWLPIESAPELKFSESPVNALVFGPWIGVCTGRVARYPDGYVFAGVAHVSGNLAEGGDITHYKPLPPPPLRGSDRRDLPVGADQPIPPAGERTDDPGKG